MQKFAHLDKKKTDQNSTKNGYAATFSIVIAFNTQLKTVEIKL